MAVPPLWNGPRLGIYETEACDTGLMKPIYLQFHRKTLPASHSLALVLLVFGQVSITRL